MWIWLSVVVTCCILKLCITNERFFTRPPYFANIPTSSASPTSATYPRHPCLIAVRHETSHLPFGSMLRPRHDVSRNSSPSAARPALAFGSHPSTVRIGDGLARSYAAGDTPVLPAPLLVVPVLGTFTYLASLVFTLLST